MLSKIKIEWVVIFFLIIGVVFFAYEYYANNNFKDALKLLNDEENRITGERDKIKKQLDSLVIINNKLIEEKHNLQIKLKEDELKLAKFKDQVDKSSKEVENHRKEYEKTTKEIENIKKNPPNRTNDSLINSLKNRLSL